MLAAAWRILNSPDWKLEKHLDNGDRVQVKLVNGKKVFKLTVSNNSLRPIINRVCVLGVCEPVP